MLKINSSKAKGGHARAKALTAAQRSEIARKAAETRWGTKLPKALCEGHLYFGNFSVQAAVLADGTRLLRSEYLSVDAHCKSTTFIDLAGQQSTAIDIEQFSATLLALVASDQSPVAAKIVADHGFSHDELVSYLSGLVDDTTGYRAVLQHNQLIQHFAEQLPEYQVRWVKVLPASGWKKFFQLRGIAYDPENLKRKDLKQLVDDVQNILFRRLEGVVEQKLETRIPISSALTSKGRLHEVETYGAPEFMKHVENCMFLMDVVLAGSKVGSMGFDQYIQMLDGVRPLMGQNLELQF